MDANVLFQCVGISGIFSTFIKVQPKMAEREARDTKRTQLDNKSTLNIAYNF